MAESDDGDIPSPGGSGDDESVSLWDTEPFSTFRAHPRRFAIGLPVVFIGGAVVGALFIRRSMTLALAVQLVLQTLGFLWLYVPALRNRDNPSD